MLGAMPRLCWIWSKRVRPEKASRRINMLHHSPTRSRLRAMGQDMSLKLVRRMAGYMGQWLVLCKPMMRRWAEPASGQDDDLSERVVLLHAAMRLDDLV